MRIKTEKLDYDIVKTKIKNQKFIPKKPNLFFRTLLKAVSFGDIKATDFSLTETGTEQLDSKTPCLFLMNHSSFIDLKIASFILYPRPFNIVCTSDGFVGKKFLMKNIGCIPTNKFVADMKLVRNLDFTLKKLKSSVLMFPEASYSFDGTQTDLPESLGKLIKLLKVHVVMIRTYGAFLRDPLYNNLQLRKVKVSANMKLMFSPEQISSLSVDEINDRLKKEFTFDNFQYQKDNRIKVDEPFRADCLNRVLYKCPHCLAEGKMKGEGITIKCENCGTEYELDEFGYLKNIKGETLFDHIPDWYRWERNEIKKEVLDETYRSEYDVDIAMLVDSKKIYQVGSGKLIHDIKGFHLTGCDGKLDFYKPALSTYSLYSDFYWYEIGDIICIGDSNVLYYCFPKNSGDCVAKERIATEEIYKYLKSKIKNNDK